MSSAAPRPLPLAIGWVAGLLAAVVGLVPWLVTGARLPLQNLWAAATLPDDMPVALLPFNQYAVLELFGVVAAGAAAAGIAVRLARVRRGTAWAVFTGWACGVIAATAQTLAAVVPGLLPGRASQLYVAAITAVIVVAFAVGAVALPMLARGGAVAATLAAAVGAVALGSWVGAFTGLGAGATSFDPPFILRALRDLIPPVLTGLALALCGWRPARRIWAWTGALAILWIGPALLMGVLGSVGARVSMGIPSEMLRNGLWALAGSLRSGAVAVLVALVIGVIGVLVRPWLLSRLPPRQRPADGETLEA